MGKALQLLSLVYLVACVRGYPRVFRTFSNQTRYGDILLSPEMEMEKRERGSILNQAPMWPVKDSDGRFQIYYYIDESIPYDDVRRTLMTTASEMYTELTCLDWVEVHPTDPRAKVKVLYHDGCFATLGYVEYGQSYLSLGEGCDTLTTTLHEMGHVMSVQHTQCRSDRDDYVEVWLQNVFPENAFNFEKGPDETYGVPYDYDSVMHYDGMSFTSNSKFTITTKNPYAQFTIGKNTEKLAWSDKALLNKAYQCEDLYAKSCGEKLPCQNNGYMNRECKCECPENTRGKFCERVVSNFYVGEPQCGGNITKEIILESPGYGKYSTDEFCTFWIQAPRCKLPRVEILNINMYDTHCHYNMFAVRYLKNYFEDIFCKQEQVWPGMSFQSDSNEAIVYFYQSEVGFEDLGFRAAVTFEDDPSC